MEYKPKSVSQNGEGGVYGDQEMRAVVIGWILQYFWDFSGLMFHHTK